MIIKRHTFHYDEVESEVLHSTSLRHQRRKNESNRKAMNRNWGNQKANPASETKTGNP